MSWVTQSYDVVILFYYLNRLTNNYFLDTTVLLNSFPQNSEDKQCSIVRFIYYKTSLSELLIIPRSVWNEIWMRRTQRTSDDDFAFKAPLKKSSTSTLSNTSRTQQTRTENEYFNVVIYRFSFSRTHSICF